MKCKKNLEDDNLKQFILYMYKSYCIFKKGNSVYFGKIIIRKSCSATKISF